MEKIPENKKEENSVLINTNISFKTKEELFLKINKLELFIFYFKLYKWNILLFSINFISYLLYLLSLESCGYLSTNMCTDVKGSQWYIKVITMAVVSGIIQSIFILLIIFNNKGYWHLLYDIPIYYLFFNIYNGATVEEHGLFNYNFFKIGFIISIVFLSYLICFIYFIRKRSKFSIIFIISLLVFVFLGYNFKPYDNCENWTKSINNTLDNDSKDYPCKIKIPKKCVLNKLGNIVDLPRYIKSECHLNGIRKNEKKIFIDGIKGNKYFTNEVTKFTKFGYPITTSPEYFQKWNTDNNFATYVNEQTIIMDYYESKDEVVRNKYKDTLPPEVILTFDGNNHGTITQRINFNESLAHERKKIAEQKNSLFKNIFVFYSDALSSKHFNRKLPKTANFFKKYFKYNENYSEKKFSSFEFLKYHSLMKYTIGNVYPMNYGFPLSGIKNTEKERGISFVKYLKENGFVTGTSGSVCSKDSLYNDEYGLPNVIYESYDHENIALFCDRNYYDYGYSIINGINSAIHRCLYGKEGYEYTFEYAEKFWNSYKENKKFFRLHIYESHEFSQELIKYADDKILHFFETFYERGYFDDTLLIIVSDHGNNILSFYSFFDTITDDREIEGMLPVLKVIIPNKKIIYDSGLYNNLYENQQTFITSYDVYNSIIHASCSDFKDIDRKPKNHFEKGGIYSFRGYSLFNLIDYKKRYCENPELDLNPLKCVCHY